MNIRCIYCGFEVGTGLRCCGVTYALNGTYQIAPEKKRQPLCNGCQHYKKNLRYCCAEHRQLSPLAFVESCTAFAPRAAPNPKITGPAPEVSDV